MQRKEEDFVCVKKDFLRTVAVMSIKINDKYPVQFIFSSKILGSDTDIVEDAKTHSPAQLGMMSGRPDHGKAGIDISRHKPICQFEATACGEFGNMQRVLHQIGVTIVRIWLVSQYVFP
jgi:hypothetical protein